MAGVCETVGSAYVGSNPTPATIKCPGQNWVDRFGGEAMRFVNSRLGRQLRLRGMNAQVVQPGLVRPGNVVTRRQIAATQP